MTLKKKVLKKKFDVVFLIHTLEHFKNLKAALTNIRNLLKDDGKMFIEIPNFEYYTKKNTYYSVFHQHLSMFTIDHLSNLLKINGFAIEKIIKKTNIIFCSVKKKKNFETGFIKINNKLLFKRLNKNYVKMQNTILAHINKNYFNVYGAGGSMVLALIPIKNIKKKIKFIYDKDEMKHKKKFPSTNIIISKQDKKNSNSTSKSISCYEISNKNNLNIQKI